MASLNQHMDAIDALFAAEAAGLGPAAVGTTSDLSTLGFSGPALAELPALGEGDTRVMRKVPMGEAGTDYYVGVRIIIGEDVRECQYDVGPEAASQHQDWFDPNQVI